MRSSCPHCKTVNVFPAEASGTMVLCPQCQKSFFADPIPEDEAEGYRACPFCHERIRTGAKKCRWCQSDLTEQQTEQKRDHAESPQPAVPPWVPGFLQGQQKAPAPQPEARPAPFGDEEELFSLHPTWKRLIAPMFVATMIIALSLPFLRQMEYSMYLILLMLFACLIWFLKRMLDIFTTHYILTTQRLRVSIGLFTRQEVEIRVSDIRAVWLKQNIWEQCLKFGDVLIGTSATAGAEISIADIDNPREVLDLMHELTKD